jgi:hypothetical protein
VCYERDYCSRAKQKRKNTLGWDSIFSRPCMQITVNYTICSPKVRFKFRLSREPEVGPSRVSAGISNETHRRIFSWAKTSFICQNSANFWLNFHQIKCDVVVCAHEPQFSRNSCSLQNPCLANRMTKNLSISPYRTLILIAESERERS